MSDFPVIIPARGGSKSIPRKNMAQVGGQTLLGRAIRTSLVTTWRVYVSTEDSSIASYARACGATVIDRPAELATDDVQNDDVYRHAWEWLGRPEVTVALQCTAPLFDAGDVRRCVAAARDGARVAVLAAPFHGVIFEAGGAAINRPNDRPALGRQQMISEQWIFHGAVMAWRDELPTPWHREDITPVPASTPLCLEVDSPEELGLLNAIHDGRLGVGLQPPRPEATPIVD